MAGSAFKNETNVGWNPFRVDLLAWTGNWQHLQLSHPSKPILESNCRYFAGVCSFFRHFNVGFVF